MEKNKMVNLKNIRTALQILLMFYWCAFLADSDSYYAPYLLAGVAGSVCFTLNQMRGGA